MIEGYTVFASFISDFYELFAIIFVATACMTVFTFWLRKQKQTTGFQLIVWGCFTCILVIGSICFTATVQNIRNVWLTMLAQTAISYSNRIAGIETEKIQPGHEEFFSDWSEPVSAMPLEQIINFNADTVRDTVHDRDSAVTRFADKKLATPQSVTVAPPPSGIEFDYHINQKRKNTWAIAALTGDNRLAPSCHDQIFVTWMPVPEASTYLVQWRRHDSGEWYDVYAGSQPFCALTVPNKIPDIEFRVRAEDGTPEDNPVFLALVDLFDIPITANVHLGYVTFWRVLPDGECLFIVSPNSDANHNGLIDADESPVHIGEPYLSDSTTRMMAWQEKMKIITPVSDEWGQWLATIEPIRSSDGQYDGLFELDFYWTELQDNLRWGKFWLDCFLAATIIIFFPSVALISHLRTVNVTQKALANKLKITVLELTETEQAMANAARVKTIFLTNMSHELRTPLQSVLGFSESLGKRLLQRCLPEEQGETQDIIKQIKTSGNELLTTIDDILGFTALDGQKEIKIENVPVSLASLLDNILEVIKYRIENKPVKLSVSNQAGKPFFILSDPIRLRQVLVNLIGNAVKFTESGAVDIEYGIDRTGIVPNTPAGKQNIFVSIHDTGIGMSESDIQMIFQPFSQADGSLTRRYGGTGIGLSVSKHTAEMLGGNISVKSTVGLGSTFMFTFPAWTAAKAADLPNSDNRMELSPVEETKPVQDIAKETDDTELKLTGRRILVVDDVKINRMVLSTQLRGTSADIAFAENGLEAIDLINEAETSGTPFDIVLMDMQMPVMDGYTAVQQLRSQGYTKPIIAVTAHALPGDQEKTVKVGCTDYLSKPVDSQKLLETIRIIVQSSLHR